MAIAYDAGSTSIGSGTSLSFSHTVSGSDRLLIVQMETWRSADQGSTPTGVTYAGVSMTKIVDTPFGSGDTERLIVYALVAPATGSNNVVISFGSSQSEIVANADSFTGVDQTTPYGTPSTDVTDNTTSYSVTLTDGATGDWVFGGIANYATSGNPTLGAGQTARSTQANGGSNDSVYTSSEAGGASVTHSYTWGSAEWGGMWAVTLFAAAGSQTVTGSLFTAGVTFNTGALQPQSVTVTGSLFSPSPSFPTGAVSPQAVTLTGSLFTAGMSFPGGAVSQASEDTGLLAFFASLIG